MLISLTPVLDNCRNNSDEGQYVLLGIDVMLQKKSRVQLVEINTIPNFLHTKEINEQVNTPFFEASMHDMGTLMPGMPVT